MQTEMGKRNPAVEAHVTSSTIRNSLKTARHNKKTKTEKIEKFHDFVSLFMLLQNKRPQINSDRDSAAGVAKLSPWLCYY